MLLMHAVGFAAGWNLNISVPPVERPASNAHTSCCLCDPVIQELQQPVKEACCLRMLQATLSSFL